MVIKTKKRISRTIPFGYKVLKNKKLLYPIKYQLNTLKRIKQKILNGQISLRQGSIELKKKTGRSLSAPFLSKTLKKDNPKWYVPIKKQKDKLQNKKNELILQKKEKLKKEKELKRLTTISSQNRINKRCVTCNKIKLLSNFQQLKKYKASYCSDCYQLILLKSSKISVKCTSCKKSKNLQELAGVNGLKAFQRKICRPCERKINNEWKKNNRKKVNSYNKKYRLQNPELFKEKRRKYIAENKNKIKLKRDEWYKKNIDKIKLQRKKQYLDLKKDKKKWAKHLERSRAYKRKERLIDPEKARSQDRKHYYKNREKIIERVINWKSKNMDKVLRNRRKEILRRNELKSNKRSLW